MSIRRWLRNRQSAGNARPAARCRPQIEALENRTVSSTFTVLNPADSGTGSLRQAILNANANPGADVIAFGAKVHGTIGLTSGQLDLTTNLSIVGPGEDRLTVSGNNASRVFDVSNSVTVTITDLTVANGATVGGLGGGGILNEAGSTLTLIHSALSNNTATAASNAIDVFGGGLLNEGNATVTASTFSGNQALGGGGSFFGGIVGGGIDNFGGATLTVTNSTFANNQALGSGAGSFGIGGAIENNAGLDDSTPSTATINNCVFTGNLAGGGMGVAGNGGALDNEGAGAAMTLSNSLLTGNRSVGGTAGGFGLGGGIMNFAGSTFFISNSLLIGNVAGGGAGDTENGGGIENQTATMTLSNSTLLGN